MQPVQKPQAPVTTLNQALQQAYNGVSLLQPSPRSGKVVMQSKLTRDLREIGMRTHDFL